jgi:hypothetical protein
MNKSFLIVLMLTTASSALAQEKAEIDEENPMNSINLDLAGEFSIFSIDYERLFFISPDFFLSGEFGFGYNQKFRICLWGPCTSKPDNYITIPHHITANIG